MSRRQAMSHSVGATSQGAKRLHCVCNTAFEMVIFFF
jgi:hypothetical protein